MPAPARCNLLPLHAVALTEPRTVWRLSEARRLLLSLAEKYIAMVSKSQANNISDEHFFEEVKYDKTTARGSYSGGTRFRDNVALVLFLGAMMYIGALFNAVGGEQSPLSASHALSKGTDNVHEAVPTEQLLVENGTVVDPVVGDTGETPTHHDVRDSIVNKPGGESNVVGTDSGDSPEVTVTREFPFYREPVHVLPAYAVKHTSSPKFHRWTPGEYIAVNPEAPMPNKIPESQVQGGGLYVCFGKFCVCA